MKVALVHDDLVQWGGAERVLLAISELFPEAPIYTSVIDYSNKLIWENFRNKKIIPSFMQKIFGWKSFYKALLSLYPIAFEQFDFSEYDLVISHSTRFAKVVITKPETLHICYTHTPPRFLWNFSGEKISPFLSPVLSYLRLYDSIVSRRVDFWLAGSKNCQKRIKKIYGKESEVVLPFVNLEKFGSVESFDGGYYLIIARLNKYKRIDLAVEAFNQNGKMLKIVGVGPEMGNLQRTAKDNVEFLGSVSEEVLLNLISGCKGLIVTAEEDFGLTPLEAQAVGKGVIAYGVGGAVETVIEGTTGLFFKEKSAKSLNEVIEKFEKMKFSVHNCRLNAEKFSKENFKKQFKEKIKTINLNYDL